MEGYRPSYPQSLLLITSAKQTVKQVLNDWINLQKYPLSRSQRPIKIRRDYQYTAQMPSEHNGHLPSRFPLRPDCLVPSVWYVDRVPNHVIYSGTAGTTAKTTCYFSLLQPCTGEVMCFTLYTSQLILPGTGLATTSCGVTTLQLIHSYFNQRSRVSCISGRRGEVRGERNLVADRMYLVCSVVWQVLRTSVRGGELFDDLRFSLLHRMHRVR